MTVGRMAPMDNAIRDVARAPSVWSTARGTIDLERPVLIGILNITPDSFSDGGRFQDRDTALKRIEELRSEGADIIDIGGESTRPGARPVSTQEELERVLPIVEAARRDLDVAISIDTTKSEVARAALEAGAEIVNDISALRFDPEIGDLAAQHGAGLVLMHMRGEPRTMQEEIHYDDLLGEMREELAVAVRRALDAGCARDQLVVDPGIGFGKTAEQSLTLLAHVDRFTELGLPVMVGPSRKSFIGKILGLPVDMRVEATIAACVVALLRGVRIFRVHDVAAVRRALEMAEEIASQ